MNAISMLADALGVSSYRAMTCFLLARLEWFMALTGVRWTRVLSHAGLRKWLLKLDVVNSDLNLIHFFRPHFTVYYWSD